MLIVNCQLGPRRYLISRVNSSDSALTCMAVCYIIFLKANHHDEKSLSYLATSGSEIMLFQHKVFGVPLNTVERCMNAHCQIHAIAFPLPFQIAHIIPPGFYSVTFPQGESQRYHLSTSNIIQASSIGMDFEEFLQRPCLGLRVHLMACSNFFILEVTGRLKSNFCIITTRDKTAMEGCNGVGVWRIVRVDKERLYENAAMNGVIPKYLTHRLFPNAKFSIWADAKMRLVVDPLLLVHSLVVKEGVDMAISKHPLYLHTMEEAMATARWKKWGDVEALRMQMETYCENGMQPWTSKKPYPSDVPDSAVIIRKHSKATNLFSCLLFNELEAFNPRDQLPFAYVRDSMSPKLRLNMFEVEVFEHVAVEYRHNLKHGGASGTQVGPRAKMASSADGLSNIGSKCDGYLLQMWGKSK
nr:uncharacterized protein LOC109191984 [Ipomoea batatas]